MVDIAVAVVPIFLLMMLGLVFRVGGIPGPGFWQPAERLTYYVLLPCLIAAKLAVADFRELAVVPMAAAIAAALVALTLLMLAARPWLPISGPRFTSVYQGAVRMNTYIGLSIAAAVYGATGIEAAAVAVGVIVPIVNVTCVLMLVMFGSSSAASSHNLLYHFVTNPLILACVAGGVLNVTGLGLPVVLGDLITILAQAALPLGLLVVGAALDLASARRAGLVVVLTAVLKLLALPAITWALLGALGVGGTEAAVAVIFSALPTATSSYILARQMGGDATLMATMVTAQTLLSAISLPVWLWLLEHA